MHQPVDPPEPGDELQKFQGQPMAMRCHWCNRTKVRVGKGLICEHCDGTGTDVTGDAE